MLRDDLLQSPFQNGANEISIFSVSRSGRAIRFFHVEAEFCQNRGCAKVSPFTGRNFGKHNDFHRMFGQEGSVNPKQGIMHDMS